MLNLLLGQVREQARVAAQAQAHQLQAAVDQQRQTMQAQAFARQAVAASHKTLDPDIADLADHFHLEESLARWLDKVMQVRSDTYESDLTTLWDLLENADNPSSVLVDKIEELTNGSFKTVSKAKKDIAKFCGKYHLDATATKNLIEAFNVRERDHDTNTERDLDKLKVHLEHSSAPSKLISMKLKEIRGGCNIGAVWHCCGDSRKRGGGREKPEPPQDRGPGIEGLREKVARRTTTMKSYSDNDLVQRFELRNQTKSTGLMTEEQAKLMQDNLRKAADERAKSRTRSRSRQRRRRRSDSRSVARGGSSWDREPRDRSPEARQR